MARKDEDRLAQVSETGRLRRRAALELHASCLTMVEAVNSLLLKPVLELAPAEYSEDSFRDNGANVFQINVAGRIVHLEFRVTDTLTSTEKYRTPYILEGSVRAFNQELLERSVVPEQFLFCCPSREQLDWLWFDPRTQRTGPLDQDHLVTLLERLL